MQSVNFYSVIIGTELLNGRRKDAHFEFLNQELISRGFTQKASFTIIDDPAFMEDVFQLIKDDESSVMFCFGGIGATPDDYTRKVAAKVFSNSKMEFHEEAKRRIENEFKQEAYPHRINMAYLPIGSSLLDNVVNNVAGFYLDKRFFFTPGFPSMSQSMVKQALDKYYKKNHIKVFRKTLCALCAENDLIDVMQDLPSDIEFSSLPKIKDEKRMVNISIASESENKTDVFIQKFIDFLDNKKIEYDLEDIT